METAPSWSACRSTCTLFGYASPDRIDRSSKAAPAQSADEHIHDVISYLADQWVRHAHDVTLSLLWWAAAAYWPARRRTRDVFKSVASKRLDGVGQGKIK
ncbi:hypothetical protein O181_033809 [Austropuccinia psidii MF-1]|uniref:Uncharacterized protein n=1 Tax=Austropuccinia psidii MF-1 TaxID=1389203 RepID=A0A9Q3H8X3_9BASI|nr:hypothetical protein [Austropuccinia psidii MF-1]